MTAGDETGRTMKFKLSAKVFFSFFILTVLSVALMVVFVRFFAVRSFQAYRQQRELDRLTVLAETLAEHYRTKGGWKELSQENRAWMRLVFSSVIRHDQGRPGPEGPGPMKPPSSGPEMEDEEPPDRPSPPWPKGPGGKPPPFPNSKRDQPRFGPRFALFDEQGQYRAGFRGSLEDFQTLPIEVEGRVVGWAGYKLSKRPPNPRDQELLREQTRMFYYVGGSILLLSAVMAWLLSRQLLSPIRRLAEATKALAQRRFETRIEVGSTDELGQLAMDFNAMAQELGEYEARQRRWISDISHELRTPLSVLVGEIEALQDGVRTLDSPSLDSLRTEADRISKIVADLHDLSLIEANGLVMPKGPVRPLSVLAAALDRFKGRLEKNGLEVSLTVEPGADVTIAGGIDRLSQLFANLLENVLRYANKPGRLWIRQGLAPGWVVIDLEDSGPGVPEESLPHLFERLYRVDNSRSRSTGGSGLGMAICKTIVQGHGGTIKAENSPRGGLRIEIRLPLEPAAPSDQKP